MPVRAQPRSTRMFRPTSSARSRVRWIFWWRIMGPRQQKRRSRRHDSTSARSSRCVPGACQRVPGEVWRPGRTAAACCAVQNCRTAALGGHVEACDHCGHQRISYNSCRNRHCPKCQGPATARWLEARAAELLPVPYFHLVFTLPAALGPLALQNPRLLYGLLLQATSQTLLEIAADPKHLGAEIGFLTVLHTWGQNLLHHPHVHCVIPAGGIAPDGLRWIRCRANFFLPVRVLSRVFRGKFIAGLKQALAGENWRFMAIWLTWPSPVVSRNYWIRWWYETG